MTLLTNPEKIPGKTITFFFVVENSAAMKGLKLQTVNTALEHYTAVLQYYAAVKAQTEIRIALLTFAEDVQWLTEKPLAAESYVWSPISEAENDTETAVSLGPVFSELNQKLSKNVFMDSLSGALPPVIVMFSASPCPDNDATMQESLRLLEKNNWDKNALKLAFAIGKTANCEVLEKWTGCAGLTLPVKNPQMLLEYAGATGRLCTDIAINHDFDRQLTLKNAIAGIVLPAKTVGVTLATAPDITDSPEAKGLSAIAVEYKNAITKNYVSLNPSHIDERIGGSKYYITRKYDGILAIVSWNGNSLVAVNSSGNPIKNCNCFDQTASVLKNAGITNLIFAAELYADESNGRSRVSDGLSALAADGSALRLAPFDIIYQGEKPLPYNETYRKLQDIFSDNVHCKPVRYIEANSKAEIKQIFSKWVESEGSEGLIIRSEFPIIYKLKPKISVDAAVVGFSECSDVKGQIRTLLYALRTESGEYQIIGRTGNGLSAEQRSQLFTQLMPMKIPSHYLEIDSNRLAFHMIRPELVIELSVNDVITENTSGSIKNPLLNYTSNEMKQIGSYPGYSFISAVIERIREDKTNSIRDVSIAQISGRGTPLSSESSVKQDRSSSKLLRREVWTKGSAVQKLLVWKTNKEPFSYPGYAASWTIFNPNIAEPFKVEMRITNCEKQIHQLAGQFVVKNIKAGWIRSD
ncbi:MAG: hypothetical protein FWG89_00040 [Treponema sp.]|nr:hypothetical protein [Treponema sp.]